MRTIALWVALIVIVMKVKMQPPGNSPLKFEDVGQVNYEGIRAKYRFKYDPHKGYEPYWLSGEYAIEDPYLVILDVNKTTTQTPQVCGDECFVLYRRIKEVCARNVSNNEMKGCWRPYYQSDRCYGNPGDQFVDPYTTFNSYCDYLEATCRNKIGHPKFILLHVGKCREIDEWFKPMFYAGPIVERLSSYPSLDQTTHKRTRGPTTIDPFAELVTMPSIEE